MRFGIYARYSSDRQSERSIDDQIRLCRERIAALGGTVVEVFTDYAISGSSMVNRPGLQAMLDAGRAGKFNAIMAEALDRLSRDQEDVAGLFKRLSHCDVKIITLSEGEVNELHVGLKGTMNALFLKDLAAKTKRGQRGRIEAGMSAGGNTFGYDVVRELDAAGNLVRGKRRINPDQAAVVNRIFEEYAAGSSPRHIAARLNAEGIASPRGGQWNASTINGNKARKNGILYNELYTGFLIYNRQTFRKDPDTGKRVARPNPRDEWVVIEVPEMRIIPDDLWERAHKLKAALAPERPHFRRRAKRLLSGLVFCGVCGGSYTVIGRDRFGCTNHRESGTCTNNRTIAVPKLERRLFDSLREQLLAPEAIARLIRKYHDALNARRAEMAQRRLKAEKALRDVVGRIARIVDAIAEGTDNQAMRSKMMELEQRRVALDAELRDLGEPVVVTMHPNVAEMYQRKVSDLQAALNSEESNARLRAINILRTLIVRIVLTPAEGERGLDVALSGQLAAFMQIARLGDQPGDLDVMKMMVAGAGFEPATFRL